MAEVEEYRRTLAATLAWSRERDYRGWDPYDALRSPLLRKLTFGSRFLGILFVQLLKNSPLNLRPLLGVDPGRNPKGIGLFLAAYLCWAEVGGGERALGEARLLARWLRRHACEGWSGPCWGFDFDWPNRSFFAPAGTPTAVNTVFIGHALLDFYESTGERDWLELVDGSCSFILNDLNRLEGRDEQCFSYTPLDRRWVHNANVLAASLLARVARLLEREHYLAEADKAVRFTIRRQQSEGSWLYGTASRDGWVDGYHTGFTLNALQEYRRLDGGVDVEAVVTHGYQWYKRECFQGPIPLLRPGQRYPVDIHCAAQGILTFVALRDLDEAALRRARDVARWTMEHMLGRREAFEYQIRRGYRIRIPHMRWGQAWMARALAKLLVAERLES